MKIEKIELQDESSPKELSVNTQIDLLLRRQNPEAWFSADDIKKMLGCERKVTNTLSQMYNGGKGLLERKKESRPVSKEGSRYSTRKMNVYRHKKAAQPFGTTVRAACSDASSPRLENEAQSEAPLLPTQPAPATVEAAASPNPTLADKVTEVQNILTQQLLEEAKATTMLQQENRELKDSLMKLQNLRQIQKKKQDAQKAREAILQENQALLKQIEDLKKELIGSPEETQEVAKEEPQQPEKIASKKTPTRKITFLHHETGIETTFKQ